MRPSTPLSPALALFPLRLFLGVTFVYAGIQKLTDPGFLRPGAATYIGTQLHGFAAGTPGGFLLRTFAIPHAEVAGVAVAITEILIGLLATAGCSPGSPRSAACASISLLFLTASWHTTPYFLGPDLVFFFAWLPFVLAGASGQPALDNVESGDPRRRPSATDQPATAPDEPRTGEPADVSTRRALLAQFAGMSLGDRRDLRAAKGAIPGAPLRLGVR